jgi:hypothetical protein
MMQEKEDVREQKKKLEFFFIIEILIKHSSIRFLGRVDDEQWEVKTVLGDAVHGGVRYFTVRLKD